MTRRFTTRLSLEPLECRETPATFVNATTVTYQDVDGDNVTIKFSQPVLTAANAPNVCLFNNPFGTAGGQQLERLRLAVLETNGLGVTVVASRSPINGGDGLAAVGFVDAGAFRLGAVTIDGDLGRITAFTNTPGTKAIASLTAVSMGQYGTATQDLGNLGSAITGAVGKIQVKTNITDASIVIENAASVPGNLGTILVGGSVLRGRVAAEGRLVRAAIVGDLVGGSVNFSGDLRGKTVGTVVIGGSVIGGTGFSARVGSSGGNVDSVTVKGDVIGGAGQTSGSILAVQGAINKVSVGGSVIGGAGKFSGRIFNDTTGSMGTVSIRGNLIGGEGEESGDIEAKLGAKRITVGGSIYAGAGLRSGSIRAFQNIESVTVNGSLYGTAANRVIISALGQKSPSLTSDLAFGSIRINGSVHFARIVAGEVIDNTFVNPNGNTNGDASIGSLVVRGDWVASSASAGVDNVDGNLGNGDDVIFAGGSADRVARINSITIGGNVQGTTAGISNTDHFGFVAQTIGKFNLGGVVLPLSVGSSNDNLSLGITGDVRLREVV